MPRNFLLLTLIVAFGVGFARPQVARDAGAPEATDQTKAEVLKVNAAVDRAVETNDADALGSVVADNIQYTNQLGEVVNKAQWQEHVRSSDLKMLTIGHKVDGIQFFGDTVVLTGTSTSTVLFHGKLSHGPRKFTRVFMKQGGKWLLIAQHVTLVGKD